jgi:AcrR family transcriptional regulator
MNANHLQKGDRVTFKVLDKPPKLTAKDWVEKGLEFIQRAGPSHLKIENVCKLLRVTKGAFYYHFSDKSEYERALLDHYTTTTMRRMADELSLLNSPQKQLKEVLRKQIEIDHTRLSLVFRAWGLENPAVAEALTKMDQARLKQAKFLFQEIGFPPHKAAVRAQVLITFLQGESGLYCQLTRQQRLEQLEERYQFFAHLDDHTRQPNLDSG